MTPSPLRLIGAGVVTPTTVLDDAWLEIRDGLISAIGRGELPDDGTPTTRLTGGYLLPGFIDVHVHGGAGASLYSADADQVRQAAHGHLTHGTTSMLASVASMPLPRMIRAAEVIAAVIENCPAGAPGANLVGIHYEGPFLSLARRGAQEIPALLDPTAAVLDDLLRAAGGHARTITIAPELPEAPAVIARATSAGLVVSLGHSDASYEQFLAGIGAGARAVTHLFNAMRPLHHRDGGPVTAALLSPGVVCEIINDGSHLADPVIALVHRAAGPDRMAFVTDAMAAAGAPDGRYLSGNRDVTVTEGVARLTGTDILSGSTLTLDRAFRRAVTEVGLSIVDTARIASTTPARLLGLEDRGEIAVGRRADLVALDDSFRLSRVLHHGRWV